MRGIKYFVSCVIVGLSLGQISLQARFEPDWPYDKLWTASDVVVVVEPLKTENNNDKLKILWDPNAKLQGLSTHFKIHGVFKGGPLGDEIILKHFDYLPNPNPEATTVICDGCMFVHFRSGLFESNEIVFQNGKEVRHSSYSNQTPLFLAFLKKAPDGTFVAITGQEDPAYSFRDMRVVPASWMN